MAAKAAVRKTPIDSPTKNPPRPRAAAARARVAPQDHRPPTARAVPRNQAAPMPGPAGQGLPYLRLTTETEEDDREYAVLFTIDDTDHEVWTNPPAGIGITALDILADGRPYSEPRANRFLMTALLGEEGYRALVSYPKLDAADYGSVAEACSRIALAAIEGPKPE